MNSLLQLIIADVGFSIRNITTDHLVIVLIGYVICFVSLAILWGIFYNLPRLLKISFRSEHKTVVKGTTEISVPGHLSVEETAAISAAIFMFVEELHDEETRVLTIQKISRRYSPWNSKIYNVINGLNKKFQV